MIKAIIFDCFGVLTSDTWHEFLDSLPDASHIDSARDLNKQYDAGLITEKEFVSQLFDLTGQELIQIEDRPMSSIKKNTVLLGHIAELKRNYKIGLLSNIGTDWISEEFLAPQEQELFDDMVFSHNVGMTKPNPAIFKLACERLGVEPHQTVMVDDIEQYCRAAEETGMKSVTYTNFKQYKQGLDAILTAE